MKFTIVATALLGLLLTPALGDYNEDTEGNQHSNGNHQVINEFAQKSQTLTKQVSIAGGYQTLTINKQRRIATVEQENAQGSWKAIVNYNSGVVAAKVLPQRVCYISKMNRMQLPSFDELPRVVDAGKGQQGQRQSPKKFTFTVGQRVRDLRSYGQDVVALCRGLPTYTAHLVNRPQNDFIQESCTIVDLLALLGLQYCHQYGWDVNPVLESN